MTREVWERRLAALKEMGCNAIRTSHNPHMPELYELCDEMGFLVMDEAFDEWENPKNKWSTGPVSYTHLVSPLIQLSVLIQSWISSGRFRYHATYSDKWPLDSVE